MIELFGAEFTLILLFLGLLVAVGVLVFQVYLWLLLARLLRLACKFLKAQLDYYHSDTGN